LRIINRVTNLRRIITTTEKGPRTPPEATLINPPQAQNEQMTPPGGGRSDIISYILEYRLYDSRSNTHEMDNLMPRS
jgi:hypothetical protein